MASKNPTVSRAVIDYANACKHPEARATLADAPPIPAERRAQIARLLTEDGAR